MIHDMKHVLKEHSRNIHVRFDSNEIQINWRCERCKRKFVAILPDREADDLEKQIEERRDYLRKYGGEPCMEQL